MRILLYLWLICLSCFGQGSQLSGARNLVDVALFRPLTSNEIFALAPKMWVMSDVNVYHDNGINPAVDGETVERWSDISGNANNLGQTVGARQPIFRTGVLNGHSILDFGGTLMLLTNPSTVTITHPSTFYFVVLQTNIHGGTYIDGINATHRCWVLWSGTPGNFALAAGNSVLRETTNTWNVVCSVFNGAKSRMFCNTKPSLFINFTSLDYQGTTLGSTYIPDQACHGQFAEVLIFNSLLNEHYRIGIELYLKKKYALENSF